MPSQSDLIRGRCRADGDKAAAARACGLSLAFFSQLVNGRRPVPVAKGAAIERALDLPRWLLWPDDWHQIWPELIGSEGAPPVPTPQETPHAE